MSSVGKNIKYIRIANDLTQAQMGIIAGVSDKAVSTWEAGIKEPRMGAIQKISDHFGVLKSDIIDGDLTLYKKTPPAEAGGNPVLDEIMSILGVLPQEVLADLLVQLQGLRDKYSKIPPK